MATMVEEAAGANAGANAGTGGDVLAVRLVVQRVDHAELLLDNESHWASMDRGLVVYVSFTKSATEESVGKAVKMIMKSPIQTPSQAVWGDGTKPMPLQDMLKKKETDVRLMLVPQAGLVSKLKGKYLQYREICGKQRGLDLYNMLKKELRVAFDAALGKSSAAPKPAAVPLTIPTLEIFMSGVFGDFSEFDPETGIPTLAKDGTPVSKKKAKKFGRISAAHEKRRQAAAEAGTLGLESDEKEKQGQGRDQEEDDGRIIFGKGCKR